MFDCETQGLKMYELGLTTFSFNSFQVRLVLFRFPSRRLSITFDI